MFQSAKMKWEKGMNDKSKSYSLLQRWEWDVQMFKEGAKAKIASPQCETCSNWIKGDVYHCKHYKNEIKPKGVVSAKKNVFIILQMYKKYCNCYASPAGLSAFFVFLLPALTCNNTTR